MMSPLVRRTWAPKGQTPIFKERCRSYKKVSAIAAVTTGARRLRTRLYFSLHVDKNIRAAETVRFLRSLRRQIQTPLMLIWDRSRIHKANAVQEYLKRHKRMLSFHFPAYAPELNPVEFFWSYLKVNPLANRSVTEVESLAQVARYHSTSIKRRPNLIRSFLKATPLFCQK